MRDDAPAALPLLAFALGLATHLVNPRTAIVGLLLVALASSRLLRRIPGGAAFVLFFALGLLVSLREQNTRAAERRAFAQIDPDRFVTITAPIDRDWSSRASSSMLMTRRFTANGRTFDRPLRIYVRATPPPIANEKTIRARGFLRLNEHGMYTITVKSPVLIAYEGELSVLSPARWNRALTRRVETFAPAFPTEVALAEAVALGRGERLDDDVRDDFKRGGTYHLLVFSGLQIALAAALMALILRWMGAPRISDLSLLAFAALAPLFVGPTASVARASVAIGLYAASRLLRRPTSLENLWALSALVRLMLVPAELTDAAFHLTYAGAGALLFLTRRAPRRVRWLAGAAAAEAAVTPLTLFHFHQYAIGGSLSTIVMTPLIFLMLIVSAAAIAVPCAPLFLTIRGIHITCMAINAAGAHSSGMFAAPSVAAMTIGFGGAVAAIVFARSYRRTLIALALVIPTCASIARHLAHRSVDVPEITFLDVGQGDAIVARDGTHVLLIDGGGRADDARFGESTLLPMLVDRGIQSVDAIVLSHVHPDHCGGLPSVIRRLHVGQLWISPRQFRGPCARDLLEAALDNRVPIHLVRDGERRWMASMSIALCVAPHTFRRAPENNSSVLVRIRSGRLSALMTGDIEREAESELVANLQHADLLKVAHHGSRSSTTAPFLEAVHPHAAVISCGRKNLFGHPHPIVLTALRREGVLTYRTDVNGSIRVRMGGPRLVVSREIDTAPPGATVAATYVLDSPPPRVVDARARARGLGHSAELRRRADRRVRAGRHASEGAPRQHRSDPRRHHLPRLREGREESGEEPLPRLSRADSPRGDLLPRAPPQRAASGR